MASFKKLVGLIDSQKLRFSEKLMREKILGLKHIYDIDNSLPEDEVHFYVSKETHGVFKKEIAESSFILKSVTRKYEKMDGDKVMGKLSEAALVVSAAELVARIAVVSKSSYDDGLIRTTNEHLKKYDFTQELKSSEISSISMTLGRAMILLEKLSSELEQRSETVEAKKEDGTRSETVEAKKEDGTKSETVEAKKEDGSKDDESKVAEGKDESKVDEGKDESKVAEEAKVGETKDEVQPKDGSKVESKEKLEGEDEEDGRSLISKLIDFINQF